MKYKKLKLGVVLVFGLGLTGLHAQETSNAAGGSASGSGGTVTFSVGQVVYTSNTGTNGSVVQGVQQPFEISTVTGVEETNEISLMISTYPNPTSDYLTLKVEKYQLSNFHFQLFNMNGKLLQNEEISTNQTIIVMSNLLPAIYFLKVTEVNQVVKTFKIIKN